MRIIKHLSIISMAIGNLRRFRARTISIVFPLALMMAVASFMVFTRGGFIKDAEIASSFLPDITVQQLEAGRVAKISLDIKRRIERLPHVKAVLPRVWGYIPLRIGGIENSYTLMGIDIDNLGPHINILPTIMDGSFIMPGDRKKAVLGYGVAQAFGVDVGDILSIEDTLGNRGKFEVAGIFNSEVQIYSTDLVVVSNADARQFFGYKENEASDLLVYLDDHGNADRLAMAITRQSPNLRVLTRGALTELTQEAFGRRGGTFMAMWLILLVTVMVLVWAQLSHMGAHMGKEIGILKALGWSTGDIIEMKMAETLICSLIGTFTGLLGGFIYALMGTPGISGYCLGCATIYPKFPVPVSCTLSDLILLCVMGIIPVTAASAIPAWLAGIIEPDACIRN